MTHHQRLAVAAVAFLCIAGGAFQPFYWRMFAMNRPAMRAELVELPYRQLPGFRRFMTGVRDRTRDGDRVAIIFGTNRWREGYEYGFVRSTYLLYGRTVIPVIDPQDHRLPQNVSLADAIAAYGIDVVAPHFKKVWQSEDGVLLRRTE
jgi:hypothetical protein